MKYFLAIIILVVSHLAIYALGLNHNADAAYERGRMAVIVKMWTVCEVSHNLKFNTMRYYCVPFVRT